MSRRPLLGACGLAALCVAASILILRGGSIPSTFAFFDGETQNSGSVVADGWLSPPTALTVTANGNDGKLSWTGGTPGSPTGQTIYGAFTGSNGTSTTCPATLSQVGTTTYATGTNTYTDAARGDGYGGEHYCYQVVSTAGTYWTAAGSVVSVQFPFIADSVTLANGNGTIATNDTVTLKFNNTPNIGASSSMNVCVWTNGDVVLGDSAGCKSSTKVGTYGNVWLTGGTIGGNVTLASSSAAVSGNTVSITLNGKKTTSVGSGTWTYVPPSGLTSTAGVSICTTSGSVCQPTTSSGF